MAGLACGLALPEASISGTSNWNEEVALLLLHEPRGLRHTCYELAALPKVAPARAQAKLCFDSAWAELMQGMRWAWMWECGAV
jgi:hypothetical protein